MRSLRVWYWRQMATWSNLFKQEGMALEYWGRIAAALPGDATVLASLAHHHAQAGAPERAIALLRESLRIDPTQAATHFNLAYLLQQQSLHEEALDSFDRALAVRDTLDQAHYGRALSLIKLGRLDEAIAPLKRNIALQPLSPYGYYQLAHVYHRRGEAELVMRTLRQLAAFEPQVARQFERETGIGVESREP